MAPLLTRLASGGGSFGGLGFGRRRRGINRNNPLNIKPGDSLDGGFFAGYISHTANGVPTHALIVAPRATGASGTGYTLTTDLSWKTESTITENTNSPFDGAANTAAIVAAGITLHPAAQFCVNLSIGGYSDWYLPARYELDIAYENLKTTNDSNNTSWGINPYSVPERTANRSAGTPTQTSVSSFQGTGAEPFVADSHWSSTQGGTVCIRFWRSGECREFSDVGAWCLDFNQGLNEALIPTSQNQRVRAFRKIPV
jgi:hypothetical protein